MKYSEYLSEDEIRHYEEQRKSKARIDLVRELLIEEGWDPEELVLVFSNKDRKCIVPKSYISFKDDEAREEIGKVRYFEGIDKDNLKEITWDENAEPEDLDEATEKAHNEILLRHFSNDQFVSPRTVKK